MRRDRIAVIELAELSGVEGDFTRLLSIQSHAHLPVVDGSNGAEVAVGDAKRFIRLGELNAVAGRELTRTFGEDIDTAQPAWIVGDRGSIVEFDGERIRARIDFPDPRVAIALDAFGLAAGVVVQHVARVVPRCPGAVGPCHIGAMIEHAQFVYISSQRSIAPQLGTHGFVDLVSAAVVGRDNQCAFWVCRIVSGNGRDALAGSRNFSHAALLGEQRNAIFGIVRGK